MARATTSELPVEIWDMVCENLDLPACQSPPQYEEVACKGPGTKDLKNLRLVNRAASWSASRLMFRTVSQTHSYVGFQALKDLSESPYASSVHTIALDLEEDFAWSRSFVSGVLHHREEIATVIPRFTQLRTFWVIMYRLPKGSNCRWDWEGVRSERSKSLAMSWVETIRTLALPSLKYLNLVFDGVSQMKEFAAKMSSTYPEGDTRCWYQGYMVEESVHPLRERKAHDLRSIYTVMPNVAPSSQMVLRGNLGTKNAYRSYRLMQYSPAAAQLRSLYLANVDIDGEALERILLCNASTLESIELHAVSLRTLYWASIFTLILQCCDQLKHLQVGRLGYLLPVRSILEKLSPEDMEDKYASDANTLTALAQAVSERRWAIGMPPVKFDLLDMAVLDEKIVRDPARTRSDSVNEALRLLENTRLYGDEDSNGGMMVTNDSWKNMVWFHRQTWEG